MEAQKNKKQFLNFNQKINKNKFKRIYMHKTVNRLKIIVLIKIKKIKIYKIKIKKLKIKKIKKAFRQKL